MAVFLFVLVISILKFSLSAPPLMHPLGSCQPLKVTCYDAFTHGSNCGNRRQTETGPPYLYVAGPGYPFRNDAHVCGVCYEITGTLGSVRVMVTTSCPECHPDPDPWFDLSCETYPLLFPDGTGGELASFREVTCDVEGPVKFQFGPTSSIWWFKLHFFNHLTGVDTFEIRGHIPSATDWVELPRSDLDNTFDVQCDSCSFEFPFDARVTDFYGDVIEFQIHEIIGDLIVELSRNFQMPSQISDPFDGTCCEPQEVLLDLYADGQFPSRWEDWTLTISKDLQWSTNPNSGTYCLRVNFNSFEWLQWGSHMEPLVNQYTYLEFYSRLDTGEPQYDDLTVRFGSDEDPREYDEVDITGITPTWQRFQIPLAGSLALDSIGAIAFINGRDTAMTLYFDDVRLVPNPSAPDISTCAPGVVGGPPPVGSGSKSLGAIIGSGVFFLLILML